MGLWGRLRLPGTNISTTWEAGGTSRAPALEVWAVAPQFAIPTKCQGSCCCRSLSDICCRQILREGWLMGGCSWGQGAMQGSGHATGRRSKTTRVQLGVPHVREPGHTVWRGVRCPYVPRSCRCKPPAGCCWWHSEKEWVSLRARRHVLTPTHRMVAASPAGDTQTPSLELRQLVKSERLPVPTVPVT